MTDGKKGLLALLINWCLVLPVVDKQQQIEISPYIACLSLGSGVPDISSIFLKGMKERDLLTVTLFQASGGASERKFL